MKNLFLQETLLIICLCMVLPTGATHAQNLGMFEQHGDIGATGQAGAVKYDAAQQTYLVTGSGENMWFDKDALHFVWKKASGDLSLAAEIKLLGRSAHEHRKACLLIRQSLEADSPYADAALHGNGLASIQYREEKGGPTREIQSHENAPAKLRLEKEGDYVSMSIARAGEALHSAGGMFKLKFSDPFYIGLGVCAHDNNALEAALFSNVEINTGKLQSTEERVVESTLEIITIASQDRRVVHHARAHFEAPNWSRDGNVLLFNQSGKLYTIPVSGGEPKLLDTGFATRCNNDHGYSPDGTQLVISDHTQGNNQSLIYILPSTGGTPKLVTPLGPSYWHGWSPDGKTLAYCAERNGNYDVYSISVEGGAETRLTTAEGLDDGPDYSPDGQYIYFNSVRTGLMQIWRMKTDGSEQTQITFDDYNNWFAHPSPDGQWLVILSYEKDVQGHPANKDVMLRLMPAHGGEIKVLAKLFGGQGTINVPSWSPDSKQLAFVSYALKAAPQAKAEK